MSQLAIVEAFTALPDTRRTAGQRHTQALCLALFTLSVTAGNRGFLAMGDWLWAYHDELVAMESATQRALTVLQHNSAYTVATQLPGLLGLFISILRHLTFTWRNHCHRRQGAARLLGLKI
ncbi:MULTISPECIES: hypothetical protein [unclassified Microcoleus]|uniref:hypothetical protein n=1 Tax=unclassified Microcoleus TaxID=2642155 RepID=UPI002FD0D7C9